MSSQAELDLIVRLRDEATQGLQNLAQQGGILQDALAFAAGGVIQSGLGLISENIGGIAEGMISGNAEFEQYNTRFEVLLGSAELAQQRMEELAEFGAKTPFELTEVVKADSVLQGFGLHSEEAAEKFGYSGEQIRTIAGDVASGTGVAFEEMSLLLGKFSAGATGEAISRMMELGITNRSELAAMGLEFSKSGELLSPLPESMETVLGLMQEKYGGLMDAQSSTFEGMMSNLQDWWAGTLRTVGEPLFDVAKESLEGLLVVLNDPATLAGIQSVAEGMAEGLAWSIQMAKDAVTTFQQAFSGGWVDSDVINPFHRIVGVVGQMAAAFGEGGLQGAVAVVQPYIEQAINGLVTYVQGQLPSWTATLQEWGQIAWQWILDAIPPIQAQLSVWAGQIISYVQAQLPGWTATLQEWGGIAWRWIQEAIPPALNQLGIWAGQLGQWVLDNLPAWANTLLEWGGAAVAWLGDAIPPLMVKAGEWLGAITNWAITQGLPTLLVELKKFETAAWNWIVEASKQIGPSFLNFLADVVVAMQGIEQGVIDAAIALGDGLTGGIVTAIINGAEAIKNALAGIIAQAIADAKALLGIQSPSRVTAEEVGMPIVQGIVAGITQGQGLIGQAMMGLQGEVLNPFPLPVYGGGGYGGGFTPMGAMAGAGVPGGAVVTGGDTFNVTLNVQSIDSRTDRQQAAYDLMQEVKRQKRGRG